MNRYDYVMLKENGKPLEDTKTYPVYYDNLGFATIGPGLLVDSRRGGGFTGAELKTIFYSRCARLESSLSHHYDWYDALDEVRKSVVFSMAYQDDWADLLDDWPHFINCMRLKDYIGAATEMLDSKVAKYQTPARFKEQAEMMRTGQWP